VFFYNLPETAEMSNSSAESRRSYRASPKKSKQVHFLLFFFIFFSFFDTSAQSSFSFRPHIAILNLEGRGGISADEAATLTDRLRGHLVNTGAFVVVDRDKTEAALQEIGFQQSGCVSTLCAVQVGKMLTVQKMVTGSIGKIGKTYTVDVSVIDVESSRIERSLLKNYQGEVDGLLETLKAIAGELARAAKPQPPAVNSKPSYKLAIYSAPKGAEVFVNNKVIGKTPLSRNVPAGSSFKIRVKYPGYRDWEKNLTMTRDEDLNVEMVAKAKSSSRTWLWVAGGVGAAAIGATAYILTSADDGGGNKTASLPPFQWPPAGK